MKGTIINIRNCGSLFVFTCIDENRDIFNINLDWRNARDILESEGDIISREIDYDDNSKIIRFLEIKQ